MSTRSRVAALSGAAALLSFACGGPRLKFGPEQSLNTTPGGAAPMFVVSPRGAEAAAWVSAPGGGSDGSLYISVDGGPPAVISDSLGPIEPHGEVPPKLAYEPDGSLAALYVVARLVPGRRFPATALRFVRSADGGHTWTHPVTVTDNGDFGSNSFHALHVGIDGTLFASWLDGRDGKAAVFLSRSTDGGVTWEPNRRISAGQACPCCRTALATAPGGVVYLAWRDVGAGNLRNIVVARSEDNGKTFGTPRPVHDDGWVIDGCPHAGPSIQVDASGRLHVIWWTGKAGAAGVWYASSDDGQRFTAPVALGVAPQSMPAHVQLAVSPRGRVLATWDDGTVRTPRVLVRMSADRGATFGPAIQLSTAGQAGEFPVIGVSGDSVIVAWTAQGSQTYEQQAHAMPDMKKSGAAMPLRIVGDATVLVRRGRIGA